MNAQQAVKRRQNSACVRDGRCYPPMAAPAGAGVLFAMHARPSTRSRIIGEGVAAARMLRRTMRPAHPMELLANAAVLRLLRQREPAPPFDFIGELPPLEVALRQLLSSSSGERGGRDARASGRDERAPYLAKLLALLRCRFARVVYLDCDLFVLDAALIDGLLTATLSVADVAMPLDPGRAAHLIIGDAAAAPWLRAGHPPMLCSAVLAYARNVATDALWRGAARRLARGEHAAGGLRQSDQEAVWFEWTLSQPAGLRVLALPEETYCPLEARQQPKPAWHGPAGVHWSTSWRRGRYRCRAVHGHAYGSTASSVQFSSLRSWNRTA